MLDVGVIASEIIRNQNETFRDYIESNLTSKRENSLNFLSFLAAAHDIGKAVSGFQYKLGFIGGVDFPRCDGSLEDHRVSGFKILKDYLVSEGVDCDLAMTYSSITVSHHGEYITQGTNLDNSNWKDAQTDILQKLASDFTVSDFGCLKQPCLEFSFLLSGLISFSDWLVSNNDIYQPVNSFDLKTRKEQAVKIIDELNFKNVLHKDISFQDVFGFAGRPFQNETEKITTCLKTPFIALLEVPTGMGKTEAALNLYLKIANSHRGLYYALPTMATSNAMFDRVKIFLENTLEVKAGLELLHSASVLNESYKEGGSHLIEANDWFQRGSKRKLLSNIGVGTIDQLLMMVLKVKHFFIRHYAIANKVVIIDEVHAYDTFMNTHLELLLGYLSKLKCSVILLSATLPKNKRQALLKAYNGDIRELNIQYPVIYAADTSGNEFVRNNLDSWHYETFFIPIENQFDKIKEIIVNKISDNGLIACVINTVKGAQRLFIYLRDEFPDVEIELFHSRFTFEDRLVKERTISVRAGKNGDRKIKYILVATQVIEQSLDIDFDCMITELAPVDLLIQRAGRVHRHGGNIRSKQMQRREVHILMPNFEAEDITFGDSGYIYSKSVLLKTGLLFLKETGIKIPEDVQNLIESVYGESVDNDELRKYQSLLEKWKNDEESEDYTKSTIAKTMEISKADIDIDSVLDTLSGFENSLPNDEIIATRLIKLSLQVVILEADEPLDKDAIYYFNKSIALNSKHAVEYLYENKERYQVWRIEKSSSILRNLFVIRKGDQDFQFEYNKEIGFQIIKAG